MSKENLEILQTLNLRKDHTREIGGYEGLKNILETFYSKILKDIMIGYFFKPFELEELIAHQAQFTYKALGGTERNDKLRPLGELHKPMAITEGHFYRRHKILEETLITHEVPENIVQLWLEMDLKFKKIIVSR